jgi:tetratricopeptide (TPR) repeat protein
LSSTLLPAELQTTLLQRAGGNPLYASEFVRMLKDRGLLSNDGRSITIATDDIPVPESIQSCIAARLDTLAPERKALLQDAAVVGKVFWNGALAQVGSADGEAIKDSLHELVRKELIRPSFKSSIQGQDEYSFRHALIRDVSYGQIPKVARGRKHYACAQWIESVAGGRVGDQAEVLAHHYERATRLWGGSDAESGNLRAATRRYLLLAGDRALQLDAGRARRFYERALEFAPADDAAHAGVLASLARAAHLTGDLTAAASLYDQAIPALLENGQSLRAGELLVWFSFLEWYRGRPQAELANIERAIEVLEAESPSAELAHAFATMAGREVVAGHPRSGLSWAEKSLKLAERLDARQVVMEALGFVGVARFAGGDAGGIHDLRQAVALGLELGLSHGTALAYTNLLYNTRLLEGPSAAKLVAEDALAFARRRGLYEQEMFIQSNAAETLYEAGDWDEALTVTSEIMDWARSHRVVQIEVQALATKILVLVGRGAVQDAASLAPTYLSGAHKVSDPQVLLPALVGVALVRQANGEPLEAMKLLAEGERLLRANPEVAAWQLPDAMRLCIAARRPDRATKLLQSVEVQGPHQVLPVRTAEAILWEATGRVPEAVELYAEMALAWNRRGSRVEEALAILGQGRCWLELGRGEDARARLEEARDLLLVLAARPRIEEANELLGRATALSS